MKDDFLGLAATDMEEAEASALLLLQLNTKGLFFDYPKDYFHQLKKGLETTVCTSYSRPFTTSKHPAGRLTELDIEHFHENDKDIHKRLLDLRDTRYAHTDEEQKTGRKAVIFDGAFAEYWIPLTNQFLEQVINLCDMNRDVWRSKMASKNF